MTVHVLGTMSNCHPIQALYLWQLRNIDLYKQGWIAQDKDDETLAEYKKTGAEDILLHYTNLHHHLCSGEAIHCPVESGVAVLVFPCMVNESWRTGRMMAWDAEKKETVSADTVPLDPFPGEMPKPSCIQLTKSDRC